MEIQDFGELAVSMAQFYANEHLAPEGRQYHEDEFELNTNLYDGYAMLHKAVVSLVDGHTAHFFKVVYMPSINRGSIEVWRRIDSVPFSGGDDGDES